MKHLKIPGLVVLAAAAMMSFASSAFATVLTSPSGTEFTGTLTMTVTSGSSLRLQGAGITDTCTESTMSPTISTNTTVAKGGIKTLSFGKCDATVTVLTNGSLEVKSGGEVITKETQVTYSDFGISCVYGGGTGTKIGTMTGGTPAFINISAKLPKISGSFLCGSTNEWLGQYTVTSPSTLFVD